MTLYLHAQLVQGGGREPEALFLHPRHVLQLLVLPEVVAHTIVSLTGDPEGLVLSERQTGEDPLVQEEHVVLKTSLEVAGQDVLVVPETIKIKIVRYNNRSERQGKTRTKRRTRTRRENQIIRESERESEREIQYRPGLQVGFLHLLEPDGRRRQRKGDLGTGSTEEQGGDGDSHLDTRDYSPDTTI